MNELRKEREMRKTCRDKDENGDTDRDRDGSMRREENRGGMRS